MSVKRMDQTHVAEMFELVKYAFNFTDGAERQARFQTIADHSWNYGYFADQQLTSQVMATPFTVSFGSQRYAMAGIGFVASYPEFRGQGGINQIMAKLLQDINEKGVDLSYLAPFSYPFYRRYGYEYVFEKTVYEISAKEWPAVPKQTGTVRRCDWAAASPVLQSIYHKMPYYQYGALVREDWWLTYKFKEKAGFQYAVYYDEAKAAAGYLVYRVENGQFTIAEWNCLNQQAFWALAGFIGSHSGSVQVFHYETGNSGSNFNYLFADPYWQVTVRPEMMARIVNVERFLANYPFAAADSECQFQLVVSADPYADWNEGVFQVAISADGTVRVNKTAVQAAEIPVLKGTIQGLSQLLLGFRSLEELVFFDKVSCETELVQSLVARLPQQKPVLEDYF